MLSNTSLQHLPSVFNLMTAETIGRDIIFTLIKPVSEPSHCGRGEQGRGEGGGGRWGGLVTLEESVTIMGSEPSILITLKLYAMTLVD